MFPAISEDFSDSFGRGLCHAADADLPAAMVIGVLGAFAGAMGFRFLVTSASWVGAFVLTLIGSLLLIWIWQKVMGGK